MEASVDIDKLRGLRTKAKLTQEALAERAGLARNTVARLESGRRGRNPHHGTIVRLAEALGVKPEELIHRPSEHDWRFG